MQKLNKAVWTDEIKFWLLLIKFMKLKVKVDFFWGSIEPEYSFASFGHKLDRSVRDNTIMSVVVVICMC